MSFSMIWPIVLIVLSNIAYHICSKQTPEAIHPLASLTVTYAIGAAVSAALYFLLQPGGNLLREYKSANWTTYILGIAIVGLEAGSLYMYKAGWNIGSGQLVHSILLAVCLVVIGVVAYHETISLSKVIGILLCFAGLFLISR